MAEKELTAREWAYWAVTGDPNKCPPLPLMNLTTRIVAAIRGYKKEKE
jgi:hypothetical protein